MFQYFDNLPRPVVVTIAVLTATSISGVIAAFDYRLAGIVFAGMVALAAVLGIYHYLREWNNRRRAKSLTGELAQHNSTKPAEITQAAKVAKLADLRETFTQGIAKFRSVEQIYQYPWYVFVGASGSGKTQAISHCNVDFPAGFQKEIPGVGGTINMNWWFTNEAVFLDTAGRLMFEEVKTGENNEWREFLTLLKRHRPDCPINGLLLTISAESLIEDSEEKIAQDATKIAQQFEVIQRTLDIRFPVFVLITKCDLLSGFREFFDGFNDAKNQYQMVGWSNQGDRDTPFQPELVMQCIDTVVKRIEKRRLSLLRDPLPQKGESHRIDEVDALYGLSQSFRRIGANLRSYLEKIFVAGPWSPKPLFLRGIYFNSSLREGNALDQEVAQALGLRPEDLQPFRRWERERAYFLHDLFTEKVFKEKGLVTRATNTRQMLRMRSIILWSTATALALLLFGSSLYFNHELEKSVNAQAKYWEQAKEWDQPGIWKPLIAPPATAGTFRADYKGDETVLATNGENISRLNFHQTLKDLASQEFKTGWVFKPMLHWVHVDGDRQLAQRIVFEGGVISPVLKAARQRMLNEKIEAAPDASLSNRVRLLREAKALAALIQIESDAIDKTVNVDAIAPSVIGPLLVYVTARAEPLDDKSFAELTSIASRTYSTSFPDRSKSAWPAPWMPIGAAALNANPPIEAGLKRLQTLANESVKTQLDSLAQIKSLRDDLRDFHKKERELDSTVSLPDIENRMPDVERLYTELETAKSSIDRKLEEARQQGTLVGSGVILKSSYDRLVGDSQSGSTDSFKIVKDAVHPHSNKSQRLFAEIDQILEGTQSSLRDQIAKGFDENELKELAELDQYLADFGNGQRIYTVRWDFYDRAHRETLKDDNLGKLIGTSWAGFTAIDNAITQQRQKVEEVRPMLPEPFSRTCGFFLNRAAQIRMGRIAPMYLHQSHDLFEADFFPPLVNGRGSKEGSKRKAFEDIHLWQGDFSNAEGLQRLSRNNPSIKPTLDRFNSELERIKTYTAAHDGFSAEITYSPGENRDFYFRFRTARFHGSEYSTDINSFSGKYRLDESFAVTLYDYTSGARREYAAAKSVESLLHDPTITIEGVTLHLNVKPEGSPPRDSDRPTKSEVLAILK